MSIRNESGGASPLRKFETRLRRRVSPEGVRLYCLSYLAISILLSFFAPRGRPAIYWMSVVSPEEIKGWSEFFQYLADLRTGIPPLLSVLDILLYRLTGSLYVMSVIGYRLCLIVVFLLPTLAFRRPVFSFGASAAVCLVFLWATIVVHPSNAETYDLFFPLFGMLYLILLQGASRATGKGAAGLLSGTAGFFLACFELTRPFILLILPVLILFSILSLSAKKKRLILIHFIPLVILSGGWRLKLIILNDGQILWSNYTGINIIRAWESEGIDFPDPPEVAPDAEVRKQGEVGFNSSELARYSYRVRSTLFGHAIRNPLETLSHVLRRLAIFLAPRIALYNAVPPSHPILPLYRATVWMTALFLGIQLARLLWRIGSTRAIRTFADMGRQWTLLSAFIIFFLAIGESGEEARLMVSALPFLAAFPPVGEGEALD